MNRTIARLFYKNSYVKVKVIYPDNRIKTFYEIPKKELIQIHNIKQAFEIQTDKIVYENSVPTLYYNSYSPTPISFHLVDGDQELIDMNPDKLYAGLENKLISQFMSQFYKADTLTPSLIVSILTLVIMIGGFLFLYLTLEDIQNAINSIWDF